MVGRIVRVEDRLKSVARDALRRWRIRSYVASDRRPWRYGYYEYRDRYLQEALQNPALLKSFRTGKALPVGYGFRLDERVIEIPWVLARLGGQQGRLMDAGSSLNHDYVLKSPALANFKTTIVTLAPERVAYWTLGVSYVFADLRRLDFRDASFEAVACISTIEHVGMDNSIYTGTTGRSDPVNPEGFAGAVAELKRVLTPGGALYVTFPFGKYENHGFFQQFDADLVDRLIDGFGPARAEEAIFRYAPDGWELSDRAACAGCEYFNVHKSKYFDPTSSVEYPPDYAAGVRAVACLALTK